MNGGRIDDRELALMLVPHAASVAHEMLRGGQIDGKYFRAADLSGGRGRNGGSLVVELTGPRAGYWRDYASDRDHGDLLELIAQAGYRGDKAEARRWAKAFLGLTDMAPGQLKAARRAAIRRSEEAERRAADEAERKRKSAFGLWLAGEPISGTPGDHYLASRGIDLRALPAIPGALRYGRVWQRQTREALPCLLAKIQATDGRALAVHRTWIIRDGGQWRTMKAELGKDTKMTLGQYQAHGGFIPISKGNDSRPFHAMRAGQDICCGEGIEDSATVALFEREARVIAAVSLGNIANLQLPPQAGKLVIIAQNDPEDSEAAATLERVIAAQQARGMTVEVIWPRPAFKDFNDQLRNIPMKAAAHG